MGQNSEDQGRWFTARNTALANDDSTSDFDSPWKDALNRYFEPFARLFLPQVHADVDWSRGYESLDKELQRIAPDTETGRLFVDVLVKVWLRNGLEQWVLVHVEVQTQPDSDLARRMFVYHYRLIDKYARPIASVAVLADERAGWRPDRYAYNLWGCGVDFQFPVVKLLDFVPEEAALEQSDNPFAAVVLAHLKAQQTAGDSAKRRAWKVRLLKGLYDRGWNRDDIWQLMRLIDWLLKLPREIERQVREEIYAFQQENKMPYVTSFERFAAEEGEARGEVKGLQEGIALALRVKFGESAKPLIVDLLQISDLAALHRIGDAIEPAATLENVRAAWPR